MPVVVTGASGGIGRKLVPELSQRGEVRAVVRTPAAAAILRASGAKVATVDLEETSVLATVMDGAHTVIHLAGGIDLPDYEAYLAANLRTTRDALEAASDAGVPRFILLSVPGASAESANVFLRAKGLAEEAVGSSGLDQLILRSTLVYAPGQRWLEDMRRFARRPVAALVVGDGKQRLAPVHVNDVVSALVAADDRADPVSGTFGIQGPGIVTADELVDLLAGRKRRKIHVGPQYERRVSRLAGRWLHPALLEVLASDSLADAPDAAAELGLTPTPLRVGD